MKRISILNKYLLRKEQEIDDLNDKYSQLKSEKDKIKYKSKNDLAMSIRVSIYIYIYNIVMLNRLKNFLPKTQTLII